MSIQPTNPGSPSIGNYSYLHLCVLFLVLAFLTSCSSTEKLWDGKYVDAQIINKATSESKIGMLSVNLSDDPEVERYICLYEYDSATNYSLGQKVKVQANKSKKNIPIASDIRSSSASVDMYSSSIRTEINESNNHDHHFENDLHRKAHFKPGSISNTFEFRSVQGQPSLSPSPCNCLVIDNSHPLYDTANQISRQYSSLTEIEVYIELSTDGTDLLDINRCHYHNGIEQGCIPE